MGIADQLLTSMVIYGLTTSLSVKVLKHSRCDDPHCVLMHSASSRLKRSGRFLYWHYSCSMSTSDQRRGVVILECAFGGRYITCVDLRQLYRAAVASDCCERSLNVGQQVLCNCSRPLIQYLLGNVILFTCSNSLTCLYIADRRGGDRSPLHP